MLNQQGYEICVNGRAGYGELVQAGRVFSASNPSTGIAPGTVISTTPPMALHNPVGSGVLLAVLGARVGFISGTMGVGTVMYCVSAQPLAPTGGSVLTVNNALIGSAVAAKGKAYASATIGTPALLQPAFQLATIQNLGLDLLDGSFVVQPGQAFSMHGVGTAGTSPLVVFSLTWEEVIP